MLLFNYSPSPDSRDFDDLYERIAHEGMIHSAPMCGEHFDMADDFDERWAAPSVTWSCGGRETYAFGDKRILAIEPAGVLTIAAGERYTYDAASAAPFRSNMISFPRWIVAGAAEDVMDPTLSTCAQLETRLCQPSQGAFALMTQITRRCADGHEQSPWYAEQMALLYQRLIAEQNQQHAKDIGAVKKSTRLELARRIERGVQFILEQYRNPKLTISDIAGAACVSQYHFIRVFKDAKTLTPMQYLCAVRMDAAMRLLQERDQSVERIAKAVGYRDRPAFMRAFKRRFDVTPSAFRGEHKKPC